MIDSSVLTAPTDDGELLEEVVILLGEVQLMVGYLRELVLDRLDLAVIEGDDELVALKHSSRFRKASNRYPHQVAKAYDGDLRRALADSDDEVAATVAEWDQHHGLVPRDWWALGREERDETSEPT